MSTSNHLLRASVSLALLSLAATAAAQQQRQAQADDPRGLEEIVVTGTRIVRRDLETSGPVTTFSRDELEISGRVSIVAGVINVITRRDFSGFDLAAGYREIGEGDGETVELSMTFGETFDGGHFVFDASYYDEQETSVAKRNWANVPRGFFLGEFQFLGSSAPPRGAYTVPGLGQVTLGPDYQGGDILAADGTPFKIFDFFGGDSYNFAPVNHSRVPPWDASFMRG